MKDSFGTPDVLKESFMALRPGSAIEPSTLDGPQYGDVEEPAAVGEVEDGEPRRGPVPAAGVVAGGGVQAGSAGAGLA
jgi:hypothetical protein